VAKVRFFGMTAGALTLLLVSATGAQAGAVSTEPDVGEVLLQAQSVVGVEDSGVPIEPTADGLVSFASQSVVEAPRTAADPVLVTGVASEIEITLPQEFAGEDASVNEDGDVVYGDANDPSVGVVEATSDGVRLSTVINDAGAPSAYSYEFGEGVYPVVLADGSAVLQDRADEIVGVVATPWAVDAQGTPVNTYFEIDGRALVQVVVHAGAAYPVVADPSVSLGWKVYVRYSKSEVKAQVSGWRGTVNDKAKYQAIFCAALIGGGAPGAVAAAACAAYIYDSLDSIMTTFKAAARENKCMEMQYLYNGMPVGWKKYSC